MTLRTAFEARWGADEAEAIMNAAISHRDGDNRGSDPFVWALLICIGFRCLDTDSFRDRHGITAPWAEVKPWLKDHGAVLAAHDGDTDVLALLAGVYDEYMPKEWVDA